MDVGDTVWQAGVWMSGNEVRAVVEPVTVIDLGNVDYKGQGPMVEIRGGERRRMMSIERLAATEAEAKLAAAERLDALAQPILDKANALRAEAAASVAAAEVVSV